MSFLAGFLIATAVGLTGVGAGSVTAPVLILFFGMLPAESVGTALVFAAAIKAVVAPVYLFRKQVNFQVLGLLSAGGIPGVLIGASLISALHVRQHEYAILLVVGATILAMALFNLYRCLIDPLTTLRRERRSWLPWIAAAIGAEVGFSSAGAGALGSLTLLSLTNLLPAQVVGTDMLFGGLVSVVGGGFHMAAGHYSTGMLWKLIAGGLAGAMLGANLSSKIPARPLRIAISLWLSFMGTQLCWKALSQAL